MRIWHYALLPYLPDMQFRGQLRELMVIMRDWRDKGQTNHLLINKVTEYPKWQLTNYFLKYWFVYKERYGKTINEKYGKEWLSFSDEVLGMLDSPIFDGWHTKEYLRMNMSNLAEKTFYGVGKSRITDAEWAKLCEGYKIITGEDYEI